MNSRIQELEEENRNLREDNYAYHQLMRIQDEREYRSKFLKDFQNEHGKNIMPDYDEIYKRYDEMRKQLKNSISKEKIKKEIKQLKAMNVDGITSTTAVNFAIKTLQELLEDK